MEQLDELSVRAAPISMKKFMGARVRNGHGEDMGVIEDMLVDPSTGNIVQLIMQTGPVIGFKKPIGLTWDLLRFDRDGIHLELEKEFLRRIPAYEPHEA